MRCSLTWLHRAGFLSLPRVTILKASCYALMSQIPSLPDHNHFITTWRSTVHVAHCLTASRASSLIAFGTDQAGGRVSVKSSKGGSSTGRRRAGGASQAERLLETPASWGATEAPRRELEQEGGSGGGGDGHRWRWEEEEGQQGGRWEGARARGAAQVKGRCK